MSNALQLELRGNRPDYVLGTQLEGWAGPPVVRLCGREAVSEMFSYEVVLRRLEEEGPFLAHRLLNTPATLRIATESHWREVHGIIAGVEEVDRTSELELTRVRLVPAFYRATQRRRSRTFVDLTLREILVRVLENRSSVHPLGHGGLAPASGSDGGSDAVRFDAFESPRELYRIDVASAARLDDPSLRSYVVQYDETDWSFLCRLLEEEGLSVVFDQEKAASVLRITDRVGSIPLHEADKNVSWRGAFKGVGARDRESVRVLKRRTSLVWGSVEVRDFDPMRPQAPQIGLAMDTVVHPGGQTTDPDPEIFLVRSYPSRDEGVTPPCITPAGVMQERNVVERSTHEGVGTHRGMRAGMRFWLRDDTGVRGEQELTITSLVIYATQLLPEDTALDEEPFGLQRRGHDSAVFENQFEVIPADVVYRPALRTKRPRIDGVHTALVTAEEMGDPPPEIHRNERGDVRVRFPWDERHDAGTPSSTWVRVSQGWAGAGYGQLFTPRVGHEVLITYLNGDPDRPLVVGRVHDAIQPVEYEKPTISTIKTKSTPDSDGFNELRFDDEAANEEIFLHAQRNLNETVLANHSTSVGGNQSNSVGGNQSDAVDGDQSNTVQGAREHRVTGVELVSVTGNRLTNFDADEMHLTGGSRSTVVVGHEAIHCLASRESHITGLESLNVDGMRTMTINGPNAETIAGPHTVSSPVCVHTHDALFKVAVGGSSLTIDPGSIRLQTPGASICLVGDTITIDASMVFITGAAGVSADAGGAMVLTAGGTIDAKAAAIKLNG